MRKTPNAVNSREPGTEVGSKGGKDVVRVKGTEEGSEGRREEGREGGRERGRGRAEV